MSRRPTAVRKRQTIQARSSASAADGGDALQVELRTGQGQGQGEGVVDVGADVGVEDNRYPVRLFGADQAEAARRHENEEGEKDQKCDQGGN